MCGITGFSTKYPFDSAQDTLSLMTDSMAFRGPDGRGTWIDKEHGIYLGHRRLAILDLSASGAQPQASHSGRYILAYNGEIYSHKELRNNLTNEVFAGTSDTEVILSCFDNYGVEDSLCLLQGAFAIAVYDKRDNRLILARDRMGEKPLYYGRVNDTFVFASELKAFCKFPGFKREIDRDSLALFLRYGYIPAPYSIYKNIYKLEPGHWIDSEKGRPIPYWSYLEQCRPVNDTPQEAVEHVEKLLKQAVSRQMTADVPVGAFLSGGVDSSLITSIMQAQSSKPVNTYTIGFSEFGFNEALYAKAVAAHLGTSHTELYVTAKDALNVIPELPLIYDEPFADSSQIPTYLVSKLARKGVTVVLTGDAGDEIFGGYGSYKAMLKAWKTLNNIPYSLRKLAGNMVLGIPSPIWDKFGILARGRISGFKMHRGARSMLMAATYWDALHSIRSLTNDSLAIGTGFPETIWDKNDLFSHMDLLGQMMTVDILMCLPYDMLVKVDRAAMRCGLEARAPILDIPVVEYAASLPSDLKIRDGETKWILRQILNKYVPREMIDRPKSGFGIPIGTWLRKELREWASDLLNSNRLRQEGYVDADKVERIWKNHLSGKEDNTWALWSVLMFQSWLDSQKRM